MPDFNRKSQEEQDEYQIENLLLYLVLCNVPLLEIPFDIPSWQLMEN